MVLLASDYDKSRFLKADDFDGERRMRIKNGTEEVIGAGAEKEKKLVVWFTNDERGLVLNKTNNRILRGEFGNDVAGWAGKIIVVFPTMTDMRGKMVPALRVRIPPPKHGQAAVPAKPKAPGNGPTAVAAKPKRPIDEEIDDIDEPPAQPHTTAADDFDDEVDF
jgi:hypothetical protein